MSLIDKLYLKFGQRVIQKKTEIEIQPFWLKIPCSVVILLKIKLEVNL